MKLLRYFRLTRWALRNDPVLGHALLLAIIPVVAWFEAMKEMRRRISPESLAAIAIMAAQEAEAKYPAHPLTGQGKEMNL